MAAIVAAIVLWHATVYVFARFTYVIEGRTLVARRYILGRVSLGRWRVDLAQIRDARPSVLRIPPRARKLGIPYSLRGVLLVAGHQGWLGKGDVYVTPDDPDAFIRTVREALGPAVEPAPAPAGPAVPLLAGVPRWLTDLFAVLCGLPALIVAAHVGTFSVGGAFLRLGARSALGEALAVLEIAAVAFMCGWMIVDAYRKLRRESSARYLIWLVAMFAYFPTAWLYYLLEWRPASAHRER